MYITYVLQQLIKQILMIYVCGKLPQNAMKFQAVSKLSANSY